MSKMILCDMCDKEIGRYRWEDSEMQFYTLQKKEFGITHEVDICNECLHEIVEAARKRTGI